MEDKGGDSWVTRMFKRRKTPDVSPALEVQQPITETTPPPPKIVMSGPKSRQEKRNDRGKELAQRGFALQVERAKTRQTVDNPPYS